MREITGLQNGLETITNENLSWINIKKPTREKVMKLSNFPFHELNLEDCLSKIQIPKLDSYDDHVFVILNFPSIDREKGLPHATQLSIFAGYDYLVTVQQGGLQPLTEAFELCKIDSKYRESFMGNSAGYLMHSIIDLLVYDLLHILMKIQGNLDDIEDVVFDEQSAVAKEISLLRREITTLRRLVFPMKRTILELSKEIQRLSEEDLTPYFDDVRDHIDKVIEVLDESKETIEIFKDTDFMLRYRKIQQDISNTYNIIYLIHSCVNSSSILWNECEFTRRYRDRPTDIFGRIYFIHYFDTHSPNSSCSYDILVQKTRMVAIVNHITFFIFF